MIDRGFTLIGFPEHENVIAHASSKPDAVKNFVSLLETLRHYGASKGETIYFSGDPATDDTVKVIDFYYVPSRFYHLTFAQKYQNKILRQVLASVTPTACHLHACTTCWLPLPAVLTFSLRG